MNIPTFAQSFYTSPSTILEKWKRKAEEAGEIQADAMSLATVNESGEPHVRFVLCKGIGHKGVCFFTNLNSVKGRDLQENSNAAVAFYWHTINKQVRLEGKVLPTTSEEADLYFKSRPHLSKIAASASQQSEPLIDRKALLNKVNEMQMKYQGKDIPRPKNWSGFWLFATKWEFWEGYEGRLHNRRVIIPNGENWLSWKLQP